VDYRFRDFGAPQSEFVISQEKEMTAIVGHYEFATGVLAFHFVEVAQLNGEPAVDVEGELQTIDSINDDPWNMEVVRILRGRTRADRWTKSEIENILKERFAFLN
jgi:hypothetical protein